MWVCRLCGFETETDDVVLRTPRGCVCLRCFTRETGQARVLPRDLRREVDSALRAIEGA